VRVLLASLAIAVCACGNRGTTAPNDKRDAGVTKDAPTGVDIPAKPLGMAELSAYDWRKRGGHPAFRMARKAEDKENWPDVVTTCEQALAADPGHLEAAWLLAVGYGKTGKLDKVLAPLQVAAAGDFGKWAPASLELPSLQPFLKTPTGEAWKKRVEQDRVAYTAALARSVVVAAGGDLYAYDGEGPRWYRLTRTYGTVIGALRVANPPKIVYVARMRGRGDKATHLGVGIVDLVKGKTSRPVDVGTGSLVVAYSTAKTNPGAWLSLASSRVGPWRHLDEDGKLTAIPGKPNRPAGGWLEATTRTARLHALPMPDVSADWDEQGLASAVRLTKSGRIISIPSPGLIDGNSAAWSPDRKRLAFVAQLDEQCAAGAVNAAVFVADAATGTPRELERAAGGLGVAWLDDRRVVIAGDKGVSMIDIDGAAPAATLQGAEDLAVPRHRPKCTIVEPPTPDDVPPEDPDLAEPSSVDPPSVKADDATDAGVPDAR
jgi:hypothetical protein